MSSAKGGEKRKRSEEDSQSKDSRSKDSRNEDSRSYLCDETISATSSQQVITTRFLVLSDTKGRREIPHDIKLDDIDVVIHAGNLSKSGHIHELQGTLKLLNRCPAALKLVIPGNNDLTLDKSLVEDDTNRREKYEKASKLFASYDKGLNDGAPCLLTPGYYNFNLRNGARLNLYAGSYTPDPNHHSKDPPWAFGLDSKIDIYNPPDESIDSAEKPPDGSEFPKPIPKAKVHNLDILLTHGPPRNHLDGRTLLDGSKGCPHLFRCLRRTHPKLHVFGHEPSGYGAELIQWKSNTRPLPHNDEIDDGINQTTKSYGFESDGRRKIVVQQSSMSNPAPSFWATWIPGPIRGKGRGGHDETLLVNAALCGANGDLINLPWVVDLELPKSTDTDELVQP